MSLMQGNQGQTGKQVGQNLTAGLGELSDVMVTELMPRYYENVYRGLVFYGVNSAAQALSLTSTTTYTGLAVANPTGSGKNLVLLEAIWCTTVAATAVGAVIIGTSATVALTTGSSSGPSGTSSLIGGGAASVAKVGASCTLGANPTFIRPFVGVAFGSSVGINMLQYKDEIAGAIVLSPGNQAEFAAVTTAITGVGLFTWAEVAL